MLVVLTTLNRWVRATCPQSNNRTTFRPHDHMLGSHLKSGESLNQKCSKNCFFYRKNTCLFLLTSRLHFKTEMDLRNQDVFYWRLTYHPSFRSQPMAPMSLSVKPHILRKRWRHHLQMSWMEALADQDRIRNTPFDIPSWKFSTDYANWTQVIFVATCSSCWLNYCSEEILIVIG